MTDNRTTELLDGLRHVGNLHEFAELFGFDWHDDSDWTWHDVAVKMADDFDQAIAATLGGWKLTAEQVREAVESNSWAETSSIREFNDSSWQGIADELNARAERTCRVESKIFIEGEYVPTPYYEYEMECGGQFRWDEPEPPNYCPECGSRVVDGTEAMVG